MPRSGRRAPGSQQTTQVSLRRAQWTAQVGRPRQRSPVDHRVRQAPPPDARTHDGTPGRQRSAVGSGGRASPGRAEGRIRRLGRRGTRACGQPTTTSIPSPRQG
jgi:hypothetical protein